MYDESYLAHHGVKGMKWGVRRYVNGDGSLTEAGKKRYSGKYGLGKYLYDNGGKRKINKATKRVARAALFTAGTMGVIKKVKKTNAPRLTGGLNLKDVTPGAKAKKIAIASAAAIAVTASYAVGRQYVRNLQYRNLENGYAGGDTWQLRNTSKRYLRSQGINV